MTRMNCLERRIRPGYSTQYAYTTAENLGTRSGQRGRNLKLDTVIAGGTVVTASDTFRADVGIRGEHIVAIAQDLGAEAETVLDATGKLVLPGGIDSHVHIAQPSGDGIVMAD